MCRFRALGSSEIRRATTSAPQWPELGLKLRVISLQSFVGVPVKGFYSLVYRFPLKGSIGSRV